MITEILNDEQGNGKYERSHLFLWDEFLRSIGIMTIQREPINSDPMLNLIIHSHLDFVIGLEGVEVECICAVYLTLFEKYLRQHPYFIKNYESINWDFFDVHVRGEDIQHKKNQKIGY